MSQLYNFADLLANTLHVGTKLRVYYVSTPPTSCAPIFAAVAGQKDEPTTCESHFLAVSQQYDTVQESTGCREVGGKPNDSEDNEVLVLGIEVLVFHTPNLTTVFVSKADSTGLLNRPVTPNSDAKLQQESPSIIKSVISTFLNYVVSQNLSCTILESVSKTGNHSQTGHNLNRNADWSQVNKTGDSRIQNEKIEHENRGRNVRRVEGKRLVLSLFARSQNQYLFPGSIENETKHVLDDRQLIKWWCRVLDELVQKDWSIKDPTNTSSRPISSAVDNKLNPIAGENGVAQELQASIITPQAFVIVPGCDRLETTRSFFPPSTKFQQPGATSRWHISYPAGLLNQTGSTPQFTLPVRCMIPRLPDDPKARYCDDLDTSGIDSAGQWRGIKTLDQFWEMMSYRQECSAGRLVGFVWVVFAGQDQTDALSDGQADTTLTTDIAQPAACQASVQRKNSLPSASKYDQPQGVVTANSPTVTSLPFSAHTMPSVQFTEFISDPGSVRLSIESYNTLADYLVNTTDFAGIEVARKSTREWIEKVKELAGVPEVGVEIEGRLSLPVAQAIIHNRPSDSGIVEPQTGSKHTRTESSGTSVNVLVGVRKKKRKIEGDVNGSNDLPPNGMARADQPVEKSLPAADKDGEVNGAQTLSTRLVRKRPKPAQFEVISP
ncbi:hypothetical protein H2198_001917 [Neophaeococcomyces mojaviensis]|uniref:Uncharacterized protein n=1 Tax=Neophaeococcomyces mojaviensis TaxID=3383035 RepID=A0ACC3AFQ6_9EURO|nr:hypothetical protein H2198_001917 [Knufia sp. JES_112]